MFLVAAILLAVFVLSPAVGIAVVALAAVVEIGELVFWRRFLRRYRVSTGAEGLLGEAVEVIEACDPAGRVRLRGELWNARSPEALAVGQTAVVTGVDGLTLDVRGAD